MIPRQIILLPSRSITNVSDFFTAPVVKERDLKRVAVTDSKFLFDRIQKESSTLSFAEC
jgi:hypothetical protein